jgi:hypothetical protein
VCSSSYLVYINLENTPTKLSKLISSPKILYANQMLINFFPHITVYIVNLYVLRAYLGPSSGGTTVCIQQLVLIIFLDDSLLGWLD